MNTLKQILEAYPDEKLLSADGLDDAIIGIDEQTMRLIYSETKVYEILTKDMSIDEAMEYFSHNINCAYVGEQTPIWCMDYFD